MDNEKLENVIGWMYDTCDKADELIGEAYKLGIVLDEFCDFFDPSKLLEALAGHKLLWGWYDIEGQTRGEFIRDAVDRLKTEAETWQS